MKVRNAGKREDKIELQMTPMIDIVFQLLVFFIMTFKIVVPEGDFNIKMPLAAPSQGPPDENQLPPIKIRLSAGANGDLAAIRMNDVAVANFNDLHMKLRDLVGDEGGPDSIASQTEVELDCAYNLKYRYVIDAVTAVSGYVTPDNRIVKLIEKIKFTPQQGSG